MSQPDPLYRLAARMAAINFVLAHGEAIGDDPAGLTRLLTEVLLRFGDEARQSWSATTYELRFYLAYDTARFLLSDLLGSFDRGLLPHDRFEWRIKFCRLLLRYMGERDGQSDTAVRSLADYYCLVWDGIYSDQYYRGKLVMPADYADFAHEDIPFSYDLHAN